MAVNKGLDRAEIVRLSESGLSQREIADRLGCAQSTVFDHLKKAADAVVRAPDGYYIKGVSTLYDEEGSMRMQWVKTSADEEQRQKAMEAAFKALSEKLPREEATVPPASTIESLCNLYTMTDCHVGMLAWGRESGEPWDLRIAEETLVGIFMQMIRAAPNAKVGIVNQMGDYLHTDGLVPATPLHHNILDTDSRYQKIVEVAVRILRKIITAALEKHDTVQLYCHEGNHDPAGSVWLRVMFAALYENEPRIRVEQSPLPYVAYQHGKTMLAFHHGHLTKNASLPLLFAAKFPEIWGATRKRYIHTGHRHSVDEVEHPGTKVIQHPTIAAADAYAARGGWLSERQATSMTYHSTYGEVGRGIFTPEMAA